MKRLLRGVIRWTAEETSAVVTRNYRALMESRIKWERHDDAALLAYVTQYYRSHLEVPGLQSVTDYFTASNDVEVIERLKDLGSAEVYQGSAFDELIARVQEAQIKQASLALVDTTRAIITKGVKIDKEELLGPTDGIRYFTREAPNVIIASHGAKVRGSVKQDAQEEIDRYYRAKYDPNGAYGALTGLVEMDKIIHGGKKGELWIHAAFVGGLKSTFARNWCYHLATRAGANSLYYSLEMPFEQVQTLFCVLHTTHVKWTSQGRTPLAYDSVKYGLLTPEEEAFYEEVCLDWKNNPEYGDVFIESPDEIDVTIEEVKATAEVRHHENKLAMLVLDHGGLIKPRVRNKDYVIEFNSVVRDAKKLALSFNKGEKIFVLLLAQINRDGYDTAVKNAGRYQLRALGYANELERSADEVTTSFLDDEHRKNGTAFFDHLKRRDGQLYQPFTARIDFASQRLYNMERFGGEDGPSYDDNRSVLDLVLGGVLVQMGRPETLPIKRTLPLCPCPPGLQPALNVPERS